MEKDGDLFTYVFQGLYLSSPKQPDVVCITRNTSVVEA